MTSKKKIFPKLKKSFKNFLTDESGKVTKKDALGLSLGAGLLALGEDVAAGHTSSSSPSLPFPVSDRSGHRNGPHSFQFVQVTSAICNHASGIVNGHFSSTPGVNTSQTIYDIQSHGSHSNHGDGGWC